MRQTSYFSRLPTLTEPLKFCTRGPVREEVIYFNFHLPLTWPMAYTAAYTTVQAVIQVAGVLLMLLTVSCLVQLRQFMRQESTRGALPVL